MLLGRDGWVTTEVDTCVCESVIVCACVRVSERACECVWMSHSHIVVQKQHYHTGNL